LADGTRVQTLWALMDEELSVNDLAQVVGRPAPSMSQHLAKLRLARLATTRRDGTKVFYKLDNAHVRLLVEDAVFNAEHAGGKVPQHHRADTALSAILAGYESIRRLIDPHPLTHVGVVIAAGIIGFARNELVAVYRIRVGPASSTPPSTSAPPGTTAINNIRYSPTTSSNHHGQTLPSTFKGEIRPAAVEPSRVDTLT